MEYLANPNRYHQMRYRRCGKSGIELPELSLGLWHNFGDTDDFSNATLILTTAFDLGITHFDLANNYGPPYGSAEKNFGKIIQQQLKSYRDELFISTKAGYDMWEGPYGNWASRKHLIASCDQSLKRMGLEYVDLFYSHRPDPNTPIEETMHALDYIVRSGRALYIGLSRYQPQEALEAIRILKALGTPCLIHQEKYSMLNQTSALQALTMVKHENIGSIVFSPLAQGLLTNKYLRGIPSNSRAANEHSKFLQRTDITPQLVDGLNELNAIAQSRNESLAQMAINWLLADNRITSVLIGASSPKQIIENVNALQVDNFSESDLSKIDNILKKMQ